MAGCSSSSFTQHNYFCNCNASKFGERLLGVVLNIYWRILIDWLLCYCHNTAALIEPEQILLLDSFALLAIHISITIFSFALHYHSSGLLGAKGEFSPSLYESLYFSMTTFTTLGYGDIQPLPNYRLTTSLEALSGMVSMALGSSMIWLWCQENMIPKEMAFFDGNRRHKKELGVTRIRIRTITGEERALKDWCLPANHGESYYYDDQRQEWVLVTEETELPENALVMGLAPSKDGA